MSEHPMKKLDDLEHLDEETLATLNDPDLDLITDYVAGELDPAQVEAVSRRLEEDPKFREFAAPILVAWGVAPHWQRFPMSRSEIEAGWDEFTRRAGFVHQKRRARRRRLWLMGLLLAALALPSLLYRKELRTAWRDWRDYEVVRGDTGWVTLRDGSRVQLAAGARLYSSLRPIEGVQQLRLEGMARFSVFSTDSADHLPGIQPLAVRTRGGQVFTGNGEFTVTTRGDTTVVEVHRPTRRHFIGFVPLPTAVLVNSLADENPVSLSETQKARLIRGGRVERVNP